MRLNEENDILISYKKLDRFQCGSQLSEVQSLFS